MHKQFDFWIGEWNVYDTTGQLVGENKIERIEQGCALKESWLSTKGNTGTSLNYFDSKDSSWHQLWISVSGNSLTLKGSLNKEGSMVLKSGYSLRPAPNSGYYMDQISWTHNPDSTVTQWWQRIDRQSKRSTTIFKGVYKRK